VAVVALQIKSLAVLAGGDQNYATGHLAALHYHRTDLSCAQNMIETNRMKNTIFFMRSSLSWILKRHRFQGIPKLGPAAQANAIRLAIDCENTAEVGVVTTKEQIESFEQ
jgi:hypothetical protein